MTLILGEACSCKAPKVLGSAALAFGMCPTSSKALGTWKMVEAGSPIVC